MKTRIIVASLIVIVFAAVLWVVLHKAEQPPASSARAEVYTCPMHPSVRSDHPGACPVCGMALVRQGSTAGDQRVDLDALREVSLSPVQRVEANITAAYVERRSFVHTVNAYGTLTIPETGKVIIAARTRGRVEDLRVSVTGQTVRKGEPLLSLYSPDLLTAEREYLLALDNAGGTPPVNGSPTQTLLDGARARLIHTFGLTAGQIEDLANTRAVSSSVFFTAPFSGTILRKGVVAGQYVDEGMVLFELADLTRLWAVVEVYETELRYIRAGTEIGIVADAFPGKRLHGHVVIIDPEMSPERRTVGVKVDVPNPDGRLKANMFVRASVPVPVTNVLVVPASAVLSTGKGSVVWVEIRSNVFAPRSVVTGLSDGSITEITSGLSMGERVAATGGYLIDSESALSAPAFSQGAGGASHD